MTSQFINTDIRRESRLVAHLFLEKPFARNEIELPAVEQLLTLPFYSREKLEQFTSSAVRKTVLLADRAIFSFHIRRNTPVRRLAVLVEAIVDQDFGNMAALATVFSKAQDKIDIATI